MRAGIHNIQKQRDKVYSPTRAKAELEKAHRNMKKLFAMGHAPTAYDLIKIEELKKMAGV